MFCLQLLGPWQQSVSGIAYPTAISHIHLIKGDSFLWLFPSSSKLKSVFSGTLRVPYEFLCLSSFHPQSLRMGMKLDQCLYTGSLKSHLPTMIRTLELSQVPQLAFLKKSFFFKRSTFSFLLPSAIELNSCCKESVTTLFLSEVKAAHLLWTYSF